MKRIVAVVFFTVLPLSTLASAEDPVFFADPNLRAAIEEVLWVYDPTPTDMLGLTSLNVGDCGISDLTGLEYARNLQYLWIRWNSITDLSPLSGLVDLRHIDAHGNDDLSDLAPLSELANLETLILRWNAISDLSALSRLSNLRELVLFYCRVSDLSPLSGLARLQKLDLNRNHIRDISALSQLTALQYLDLRNNPLDANACNIYIPEIAANNPDVDLRYDGCGECTLSISSQIGGHVAVPGEGDFTYDVGEVAYLEAEPDMGYVFSHWAGGFSGTENPAVFAVSGDYEISAYFRRVLEALYVDDDAPGDIGAGDSTLSDPQEDGTAAHPFDSIQEAINVADEGVTVVVRPGVYHETIDLLGKHIELTGIDPNDPGTTSFPVIEASGIGPTVTFSNGESSNCLVRGFVITGGLGSPAGAVYCRASSPTIANCVIVGNRSSDRNGAAVYCVNSEATLANCTIAANSGGALGAGLCAVDSRIVIANSILWGNAPTEILLEGTPDVCIVYSDIAGGWPGTGNIDADPLFAVPGYWADTDDPTTHVAPRGPHAIWIAGDYHLQSQTGRWHPESQTWLGNEQTSLCIDAGDPNNPVGSEPTPNGGILNMGAYGGTTQASKSL